MFLIIVPRSKRPGQCCTFRHFYTRITKEKMLKIRNIFAAVAMVGALAACGERVTVPPAHIGKVLTKNGYHPDNYEPSKFRLPWCWFYCDALMLAELTDTGMKESFRLFMPKDQLNMKFDIRFTMSIRDDEQAIDSLFNRVKPVTDGATLDEYDAHGLIRSQDVYVTYGQPVLREVIRTIVSKYTINEVASSRPAINAEIYGAVSEALKGTPVSVKRLAFADLQFPDVITKAKEIAAERRAAIKQAEAEKQIMLVNTQTALEKAKAERAVRRERALAAKEENAIYAESVTDKYLQYRTLEVLEKLADNPNTVFVPVQALDTVGMSNRIFNPGAK